MIFGKKCLELFEAGSGVVCFCSTNLDRADILGALASFGHAGSSIAPTGMMEEGSHNLPQMWIYALPGLSNLWMILIKVTPLLFLLGVEDIVYWARELGSAKTSAFSFPHPDWRLWYFLMLLLFYLGLTKISEIVFARLMARYNMGQATLGGNRQPGEIGR